MKYERANPSGFMWIVAALCAALLSVGTASAQTASDTVETFSGYFDFEWHPATGRVLLHVNRLDEPFLYQTSLARGIGSNDLGADRGRLGDTRLVEFFRSGNKLLLIEDNVDYRANSSNEAERRAIDESFAHSVIWGFPIEGRKGDTLIVDATDFLLRDALSLSSWLGDMDQGAFKADASRSAIYLPRTRAFADNTEFEAILTMVGTPKGDILPSVVPDPRAITVHIHHSFVRLPEAGYEPLVYDPRAGYLSPAYGGSFADYAVPIAAPIKSAFTRRHRLHKKDPSADVSEAVEPIVYYLDPGAPEPVRQALLDGARWWNEAFEAAGYKDAFDVQLLPEGADPMDVRYNVIQWVHRSTRGWSYGASVIDPRTGEIIKGHVSLGSLRVRQDYLLAEGLLAPYADSDTSAALEAFALARIRQLSAHEVGHTLGLEHNFAGSVNNRASVMDYPFPLISLDANGNIDVSQAYGVGLGAWDKRAILWGYQDFPDGVDASSARQQILMDTLSSGLKYVADIDARSVGTAHIDGNLWDNGEEPVAELQRLMRVRDRVLQQFSADNIPTQTSYAKLEEVLVPMYLLHRFQIQAAGKVLGGGRYTYNLKGDNQPGFEQASAAYQRRALTALLNTLSPESLLLPASVVGVIAPRPPGVPRDRESFDRRTGPVFDEYAPADAAIALTLNVLLDPSRGERLLALEASEFGFGLTSVIDGVLEATLFAAREGGRTAEIQRRLNDNTVRALITLMNNPQATTGLRGSARRALMKIRTELGDRRAARDPLWHAHDVQLRHHLDSALEAEALDAPQRQATPPPGSPIG